jgi:haloalkane dehalogenase
MKFSKEETVMIDCTTWKEFRALQKEVELPAFTAAHIPVAIRYIDTGQDFKGTVLLMHGIPTWGYLYHAVIPLLVKEGYRVIAPDFLGHGWSDRRDRFDRSFQDQARMIIALLDNLQLDTVDLVGHDTGGAVALILAIEHQARVNRLVLTNSVCYDRFDDDMLDFGHPMKWNARPVSDLVDVLEESLAAGLSDHRQLTTEFKSGIIAPWASEEGKLNLLRNASALNVNQTMALVDRHDTICVPTMILWGMDDPWQKFEDGKRLSNQIPGALFVPLIGVSHWAPQDAPKEFTAALLKFFGNKSSG